EGSGDPGKKYDAQFSTKSMWPKFNPDRHYYVTRCVPGRVMVQVRSNPEVKVKVWANPAESGRYAAEARPLPGQDFEVRIMPEGGQAESYEVRCLPSNFPTWRYKRLRKPPKGMFMVSSYLTPGKTGRVWLIVFDQDGTPRWWYSPPYNTLGGQVLYDGTVQFPRGFGDGFGQDARTATDIRDLDGNLVKTVRFDGAPTDGHEYYLLPNGNQLVMSYDPRYGVDLRPIGGRADRGVLDGAFQEQTPDGRVLWSWNSGDHIPLTGTPHRWWIREFNNPHFDRNGKIRYDHFHLNSIEPWGDQYVISTRHTDSIWGISKKTGDIVWKFGGVKTPESLKVVGDDPYGNYPISGNHDARMVGDVLTVHDNGTHVEGRAPRALRYRIDLKNRTATYIGAFTDKAAAPSSHCCGSFRPLGDGWVVSWGDNPWVDGFDSDGQLAFRLGLPVPAYRAVPVPASVTEADLDGGLDAMEPDPPMSNQPMTPLEYNDRHNLEDKTVPSRKLGPIPEDKQQDLGLTKSGKVAQPDN
ncbi:MAG TPA: arylsulfotransferase family protein, partial [Solirubrobacterales bacterium]|nr:arylsulfotransferase family protein [Solirubrobacterales bacterium]